MLFSRLATALCDTELGNSSKEMMSGLRAMRILLNAASRLGSAMNLPLWL
jgi:hypothetical protein